MATCIPIEVSQPNQQMSVALDGVEFILRLFWNDRDESWYIDVSAGDGTPIWMGSRVATGVPILHQCVHARRPAGELVAIDTLNEDKDPDLDDFGADPARIQLIYIEAADLVST